MGTTAAVLGASGFGGGELLRLLAGHPGLDVVAVAGDRAVGAPLETLHPHLAAAFDLAYEPAEEVASREVDVLFSCLPSGVLGPLLGKVTAPLVIDLSDEHRHAPGWTYGLPELGPALGPRIANPGCYPTAVLLATMPFASAGAIGGPVIVDAMSGASGAGRSGDDHLSFSTLHGDIHAYGTTAHRHVPEMEAALLNMGGFETTVSFTPHLAPLGRGLLATVRAPLTQDLSDADALEVLHTSYAQSTFVSVTPAWPSVKAVAGSNGAVVHSRVDARAGLLITTAAIDNLGKGAAGQALQNANLNLGFAEDAGLTNIGVWP